MAETGRVRARAAGAAAVALVASLLAGVAARADDPPPSYVALGDSYTAGPGIPDQVGHPPGCRRSTRNYPNRVAAALGGPFRDASCSGATTSHLTGPQVVGGGVNPPQLDAVGTDTDVVTVGIGGNDIGFGELVVDCIALAPVGSPCRDRYVGPAGDEVSRRIEAAAPRVAGVLTEVRRRAPSATVFVVGYPSILPELLPGCWPLMPYALADVAFLRDKQKELNAMLATQAASAGAVFVDTYGPSVGHDACALPLLRWVEPVVPTAPAAPVHPNARGMRGIALAVLGPMGAADRA